MLTRLTILLGVGVLGALGAAVLEDEDAANREGKLWWPVKYVVDYRNTSCTTSGGYQGYCFTDFECMKGGGKGDGHCGPASGEAYGVCCDYIAGGNTVIGGPGYGNSGYAGTGSGGGTFWNKGYPNGNNKVGTTTATLNPPANTCQVKLTFEEFDLIGPVDGDCSNDTFIFVGANTEVQVPILCGYNTGQEMYINVDSSEGPWKMVQTSSSDNYDRKYKVNVDFFTCSDPGKAPPRCLQYYPKEEGEMMSFNYNPEGGSQMLNNQNYNICFGYCPGKCDISIQAARLDLGRLGGAPCDSDYVAVGCNKLCGDSVGDQVIANSTGYPVQWLNVVSDGDNSNQEEGFMASYMMLPCEG